MRRPLIGLTGFQENWVFNHGPHRFTGVEQVYTDGLLAAGGLPVLLMYDEATAADVLDHVDGLLLTGGPDVEPARYDASPAPETGRPDRERDAFEIALVRGALDRGLPLLAVCRGNQLVNVALGGTLLQHVPGHEDDDGAHLGVHEVDVLAGSRLASLLGDTPMMVNSLHHQAVASVAPCLQVAATAPDGIIEATEHPDLPLLAVQWHPERQTDSSAWSTLASWLIEQSRAFTRNQIEVP